MASQEHPLPPVRGAVDLSALAAPASTPESGGAGAPDVIQVTEANLQDLAEQSMQVPVVIHFGSQASPASKELGDRLRTVVASYDGKFALAYCDVDAQAPIAQALQIQAVPAVVALVGGRPAPLFQGNANDEQVREILNQVLEVAQQAGVTGTVEGSANDSEPSEPEPEPLPPLHQQAFDAIENDDFAGAAAAFEQALKENPKDGDARAGLAQVRLMERTRGLDLKQVRQAAADSPEDPQAQMAVADLDITGGKIEDAFARLIDVVRTTSGPEREEVRQRLVELFEVVGAADPRVVQARQTLASALY